MERASAINTIKELPKEFELDELIEKLIFIDKVEKGLKQAKEGNVIDHKDLKEEIVKAKVRV